MGGKEPELYDEDTCPSCQTLAGDAGPVTGGGDLRVSKMGKLMGKFQVMCMVGQGHTICVRMQLPRRKMAGILWTSSVHRLV